MISRMTEMTLASMAPPARDTTDAMIESGEEVIRRTRLLRRGTPVVIVAGTTGFRGASNMIQIARFE